MEELWRLRPSLFYGDRYCSEDGAHLEGTRRPCLISDMFGSCLRMHTIVGLCARDYSLGHGGDWALQFSG
jgi:hypothetical protein